LWALRRAKDLLDLALLEEAAREEVIAAGLLVDGGFQLLEKGQHAMRTRRLGRSSLDVSELREIDQSSKAITVHGNRYPDHLQRMTGR
jgi:hypothetical protein